MNRPDCPKAPCSAERVLSERYTRFRRGDREVNVRLEHWRCGRCVDPDTGEALAFTDRALGLENEAAIAAAWQERHGEPIPPRRPPGRRAEVPREEGVLLLLSRGELSQLDAARGDTPRTAFIREAIAERLKRTDGGA